MDVFQGDVRAFEAAFFNTPHFHCQMSSGLLTPELFSPPAALRRSITSKGRTQLRQKSMFPGEPARALFFDLTLKKLNMKKTHQPPGKRSGRNKPADSTPNQAASTELRDASGQRSGPDRADAEKPSEEEVINRWRSPVTNQDEQEKVTNTGPDDIPVADK